MNDETHPTPKGAAPPTPNRSSRRKPPLIEGDPVREIPPAQPANADAAPAEAATTQAAAPAPLAPANDHPPAPEPEARPKPDGEQPPAPEPLAAAEAGTQAAGMSGAAGDATSEPAPKRRRALPEGLGAMAAVSLASATLAAILVYAVTPSGPGEGNAWPGALEARIDAVERTARDAARRAGETSEALRKITDAGAQPSGGGQVTASLEGRLAALEKVSRPAAFEAVEQRLAALEKALAAPKADARATEDRAPAPAPVNLDPLRQQVGAVEQRLQAVERQIGPLAKDAPEASRRVDALAQAAESWDARLKAAEERLQPLGVRLEEARGQAEAERKRAEGLAARALDAARLALAQSIVGAIDAGTAFAAQTDALARLDAPAERLAPLKETAGTGVATLPELTRAFAAVEDKAGARQEPGAEASLVDRLASSASSLVRVRPAGDPTGDGPAETAARVRRALERGDLQGALQEWEKLPAAGKAASAAWAARARARLAAQDAARAILGEASERLGRI